MGFAQDMAVRLPAAMSLPTELRALFDWMEANHFFTPSNAYAETSNDPFWRWVNDRGLS